MKRVPEIGSEWRSSKTGRTYRVIHAEPGRVLLQGDVQTVTVPHYEWPGIYRPMIDASEDTDQTITALLVGGAEGRHFERLWDQAAELGVEMKYHWGGKLKRVPDSLPIDINLVIFLSSHIGHAAQDATKNMAKGVVPIAHAPSGGFKHYLEAELDKLGFERFGATPTIRRPSGHYSWEGRAYVWKEHAHASGESAPPPHGGGSRVLALGLTALALFGLTGSD